MEAQQQQQERSSSLKDVLLPRKVEPTQYDLTLQPNLLEFTFEGRVVIHLKVNESTNSIKLHSKDLRLSSAKLRLKPSSSSVPSSAPSSDCAATAGEVEWEAQGITYDDKNETVTLEFDATLADATKPQPTSEQQEAELDISYSGNLNDKLCGFYRNKYVLDGETRYGATTQFEPTDARRALPCWDEPAVKAVFRVTMVVPSDRVAISNMPIRSSIVNTENRTKTVEFEPTPIMSTYLLAFVVGEYDFIEDTTKEGVKMRCYTPVGKSEQGRFALNVAVQALSFFTEKFGIPYPLPKLDMIAITDFSAGAMENWGLVTYREAALLIDDKQSSGMRKQGVARTVSHELAHQWFGNLVTMDWWTWLWLNEGFARYVEHLSVNQLFPEWDIWTQFVGGVFGSALALDSLKNSHAIEVAVTHPGEINEIFDSISYAKGASVIRMLSFYLGEDTFLKGLNVYLTRHQYANATSDDLWKALTEVSGKPVEQIMEAWTRQVGYPVLTIKQKQVNEEEGTVTFTVHQQRFLASEKEREKEAEEVVWKVPISVQTEKGGDALQFFLVDQKTQEIAVRMQKDEWIKANARQTGVFRVEYEEELLQRLGRAVSSGSLPPSDILGLESDLYALCKSGKSSALTMKNYLEFIHQHMSTTRNYSLWSNISSHLDYLSRLLSHQPFSSLFQRFRRELFSPLYEELGWEKQGEEESHLTMLLRALVIDALGESEEERVLEEGRKRFEEMAKQAEERSDAKPLLQTDLISPVYRMVAATEGERGFEKLLARFRASDFSEEQRRCLVALGSASEEQLLNRLLDFCLTDAVRSQDIVFGISAVSHNPKGRQLAWDFLRERWEIFDQKFGGGQFLISHIIGAVASAFDSEEKAKEVEAFFETHPSPSAQRTIQQSLERIRNNAAFLTREAAPIGAWLQERFGRGN